MRVEERVAKLEAENALLREQLSQLLGYVAENVALREQITHSVASPRGAIGGAAGER
jgi:hypothetical protein